MNAAYYSSRLPEAFQRIGGDMLNELIEDFSCPENPEIERFLHDQAVSFSRQRIAETYLVFYKIQETDVLVGYFTLTYKHFQIDLSSASPLSNTLKKRIKKFAVYNEALDRHIVAAPLIGQLGKNFANGCDRLITGSELLHFACDIVEEVQRMIGGRIVYLECEDSPRLIDFYETNDFIRFGARPVADEPGKNLIQMLEYLR